MTPPAMRVSKAIFFTFFNIQHRLGLPIFVTTVFPPSFPFFSSWIHWDSSKVISDISYRTFELLMQYQNLSRFCRLSFESFSGISFIYFWRQSYISQVYRGNIFLRQRWSTYNLDTMLYHRNLSLRNLNSSLFLAFLFNKNLYNEEQGLFTVFLKHFFILFKMSLSLPTNVSCL